MRDRLEHMLTTLGLTEKEAKVYLANLSLGVSTAQMIAAKATVNRPTTYVMIESLIARGLVSSFVRGKKRYFTAADPRKLMTLIEREEKRISAMSARLKELLPNFNQFSARSGAAEEGGVSVFEGIQAVRSWQDEVAAQTAEVREIIPFANASWQPAPIPKATKKKRGKIRRIYIVEKGVLPKPIPGVEMRMLPAANYLIDTEMSILVDKVALTTYAHEQKVIVIAGSRTARTFSVLFDALWQNAKLLP